jgi:uncharacterized protein (DUF1684 family)
LITAVVAAIALVACTGPANDGTNAVEEIVAARTAKDKWLKESTDSPIPADKRSEFLPLAYFAVDPSYRVPAVLTPANSDVVAQMPTSTGQTRAMRRVGTLEFMLKGQPMKLAAFAEANQPKMDHLFIPFTDLTSGTETYPAGRYLDLDRSATGIYVIDFNRAYHPFCYFNPSYDCPYPPPENRLRIPIHAGERLPKSHRAPRTT